MTSIRRTRRRLLGSALAAGAASAFMLPAWSQDAYPNRQIRIVVPFPPGGALDVLGRLLATGLAAELKQPVIVDNRPGATGHVGGEAVARAAPDGYTLLFTASSTQVVSPHLMRLGYKPSADLVPVALAATVDNVVVVNKDLPVHTMAQLIAYAKANPGKISYGSYGLGSNLHLAGEMLSMMAGIEMVHVPYSNQQLIPDLISGRIQLHVGNIPVVEQHVKTGALRALAVTSARPLPEFPGLPTVAETLPGYAVGAWGMLMAPAKTPAEIVSRLNAASNKYLGTAEAREAFGKQRFAVATLSLPAVREFLQAEDARWGRIVRDAKIPMQN